MEAMKKVESPLTNKKNFLQKYKESLELLLIGFPGIALVFIFCYVPMFGAIIAFKNYKFDLGILGSEWVGLDNFEFFFKSSDAVRVVVNTIGLNSIFIITGTIASVIVALLLYELKSKIVIKIYQTIMILPHFLSWVVVGFMLYAFLNPTYGIVNRTFGIDINWYSEARYWPTILAIANIWKSVGLSCIIYYSGLLSIDNALFEAADLEGANKFQKTWYISLPSIIPLTIIMTILALGNIFRADFGMFYQLTRNAGALYSTTDVMDTYVFRALKEIGDVGMSSAVGLFQSVVGFITILIANGIVRRISPDDAMF